MKGETAMAKMDLHKQPFLTLMHIKQFLGMCLKYGIENTCKQVDTWMEMIQEEGTPVPADKAFVTHASEYMFANEKPSGLADVHKRLRDVTILINIMKSRDTIRFHESTRPIRPARKLPIRRSWTPDWVSILVDDNGNEISRFKLPHQQKSNPEYDIGTYIADVINFRSRNRKFVGINMPKEFDVTTIGNKIDVFYSFH